jgi:hypothetical protein
LALTVITTLLVLKLCTKLLSVMVTLSVVAPATVGVPVIAPLLETRKVLAAPVVESRVNVYGRTPQFPTNWPVKAEPTPALNAVLVITGSALQVVTLMLYGWLATTPPIDWLAEIVKLYVPICVNWPERRPVPASVRPVGSVPEEVQLNPLSDGLVPN